MAHSEETKRKIGNAVRQAHVRRKLQRSPSHAKMKKVADGFTKGHPDGVIPTRVRNYGDFGVDDIPVEPLENSKKDASLPRHEERHPDSKVEEWKMKKEGTSGGQIRQSDSEGSSGRLHEPQPNR